METSFDGAGVTGVMSAMSAAIVVATASCVFVGCSSSSSASSSGTAGTLSFRIFEAEDVKPLTKPLAGVTAIIHHVDDASRPYATAKSDADGRVVLTVDPTKGPLGFTAFIAGHMIRTSIGIDPSDANGTNPFIEKEGGDIVVGLEKFRSPLDLTHLTGLIAGKLDPANVVTITTTSTVETDSTFINTAPNYELTVMKGRPFTLVAFEWKPKEASRPLDGPRTIVRWTRIEHPAIAESEAAFTLDLASGVPLVPKTVTGRITKPVGGDGNPTWFLFAGKTALRIGVPTSMLPSQDGLAFDFIGEVVPEIAADLKEPPILQSAVDSKGGGGSVVFRDGSAALASGAPIITVDDLPGIPATPAPTSVGGVVTFAGFDKQADAVGIALRSKSGQPPNVAWIIASTRSPTNPLPAFLRIPKLPDEALAILPSDLVGTTALNIGIVPTLKTIAARQSSSGPFDVTR